MEISKLELVKQALLEAMQKQSEPTQDDINKSAQDALDDAIEAYITNSNKTLAEQKADAYTAFTESGGKDLLPLYQVGASTVKTMKKKGIAITHQAQKYSANNRPVSLLMKSGVDLNTLTREQRAVLERLGYSLNGEV